MRSLCLSLSSTHLTSRQYGEEVSVPIFPYAFLSTSCPTYCPTNPPPSLITTSCLAVSSAVARTAPALHRFVRLVRESRVDVIALSAELHALGGVLELLEDAGHDVDAASSLPRDIAQQTPAIVTACGRLVHSLEQLFVDDSKTEPQPDGPPPSHPHDPPSSLDIDSQTRWTAMRKEAAELRPGLEVYRLALGLALDLVAL